MPLFQRILSDHLTPVLAYRCLVAEDERSAPSFLFESVVNGEQQVCDQASNVTDEKSYRGVCTTSSFESVVHGDQQAGPHSSFKPHYRHHKPLLPYIKDTTLHRSCVIDSLQLPVQIPLAPNRSTSDHTVVSKKSFRRFELPSCSSPLSTATSKQAAELLTGC